jgi:LPXTG-motif cell wall-anchored protein
MLLQQEWPHGEETFSSVPFYAGDGFTWPVIFVAAVVLLVGGSFWWRKRKRRRRK